MFSLLVLGLPILLLSQPPHRISFDWNSPKFHELGFFRGRLAQASSLSTDSKSALIRAIETHLRPQMSGLEIGDERELRDIVKQSRVELVDLNEDGVPEVIVQPIGLKAGCGATGNCPFWIFTRNLKGFHLILDTGGQMYRVERSSSNGYSDLAVASHDSASEKTILGFRFKDGQYREMACYRAWWSTPNGKMLSRPTIGSCPRPLKQKS
jgi:hypothetical protein